MTKNVEKTKKLTVTSLLAALVVIVSFLPLKTLGLEISFAMVPVAVGAIVLGPLTGAILGGVFGAVSFLQCFGYSAFGALVLSESFIGAFLMCFPTRVLAGFLTGVIYKAIAKSGDKVALILSSIISPLLNTVFFMSALVLIFYNGETIQGFVKTLGAANPFSFVILFVGINGLLEIIAGFIVTYPVSAALKKRFGKIH